MNIQIFTVPFITSTKFSAEILQSNLQHQNVFMCNRILEKPLWSTEKMVIGNVVWVPEFFSLSFPVKMPAFVHFSCEKLLVAENRSKGLN